MPRRSSAGLLLLTLSPPRRMSPEVMSISRLTIRIAVVLPQPDGPTSTQISPAGTSRLRSSTAGAGAPGYSLVTARNSMLAADCVSPKAPVLLGRRRGAEAGHPTGAGPRCQQVPTGENVSPRPLRRWFDAAMPAERDHDILVLGATGFTGALTAEYL